MRISSKHAFPGNHSPLENLDKLVVFAFQHHQRKTIITISKILEVDISWVKLHSRNIWKYDGPSGRDWSLILEQKLLETSKRGETLEMSWMLSKGSKLTCINPPQWQQKTHLFASRSGNVAGGVLSLWEAMFRVAWFKRLTTLRLGHIEPPEGEQSKSHSSSLASSFSSFSSSLSSSLRKRSFESSMVHEFQLVSASHRHSHQGEEHCDVEIDWRARTNAKYYWLLHITQLNLPCTTYNRTWWTTKKQEKTHAHRRLCEAQFCKRRSKAKLQVSRCRNPEIPWNLSVKSLFVTALAHKKKNTSWPPEMKNHIILRALEFDLPFRGPSPQPPPRLQPLPRQLAQPSSPQSPPILWPIGISKRKSN